jgi:uncharacterized protein with HEPN domain
MQPRTRSALADVVSACDQIIQFVNGEPDSLLHDRMKELAIERLIQIIGEALVRVRDVDPGLLESVTKWSSIIGMRNVISHGYDKVDTGRVRDTVRDDIPTLKAEVDGLLAGP